MINYYEVNYLQRGRREKILLKAVTRKDALALAKSKLEDATVLKIQETTPPLDVQINELKEKYFGKISQRKANIKHLVSAIRQLAVMTNAGISIHDSIREVRKSTVDPQLKEIFSVVEEDLNSGLSLTESMSKYQYQVGDVTIAMIELGETTGNISESFKKLADILEEMMENSKKLKSALRYPITVMVAIAIAFTILMVYVVPKFKEIFEKLGANLPVPTKILLFCESAINNYGLYLLAGIIAIITYHKYMYKNNDEYKPGADKYFLKIYLIGDLIFYASMSRFMLIFTELVRAGIPIADALDTAVLTIDNEEIKEKLSIVKTQVERGANLTDAFVDTELFEGMLIQMIRAGESSGALDAMLEKVSDYYKEKFNNIIDNLSSYIEPILIGFIAVMVLMLALGIFMPMWDLAQAVKN